MAEIRQLRPQRAKPPRPKGPPSLRQVVAACVADLEASASLDDLVAKVRSTLAVGVYEDWAKQAFRDAVGAIAETRR